MERLPRRRSLFVALFVAITWAASTFAAAGILAVVLETPAPPFTGLVGLAVAGTVVWLAAGLTARATTPWVGSVAAAAAVYLVIIVTALLGSFRLFAEQAVSPFVIVAAVLAAIAVAGTWFALRPARPPKAGLSGASRPS
jgi:hypothetical protein